jgi:hypothetical protein
MAGGVAQLRPLALWPLGVVTVATTGTPVSVLSNISTGGGITKTFECRQLLIQVPTSSPGSVFVNYQQPNGNGATGLDTFATMRVLLPGQSCSFPEGALSDTKIDLTKIYLDASVNATAVVVTAISGS